MPTLAPTDDDIELITSTGFQVSNEFKLLGLNISNNLDTAEESFNKIKTKVINLIRYWERFKLTLPGRITIAKTFLISQLNYIGCFLLVLAAVLDEIQQLIDGFIKKNCLISRERMYRAPEQGGLGTYCLRNFLQAQKCIWISRAVRYPIDNWQHDLVNAAPDHKVYLIRPIDIDINAHPLLYGFAVLFRHFYGEFTKANGNYHYAYIFDNPAFTVGLDFTGTIDENFFGRAFYEVYRHKVRSIRYIDCFNNNNFKSQEEFQREGLPLRYMAWMRLRTCILHARDLLKKADPLLELQKKNILDWLSNGKGSKKYRKILDLKYNSNFTLAKTHTVITFFNLIELPVPAEENLRRISVTWNIHSLHNNFREFCFKLRNNILPLNNRINAFDPIADPRCGFCQIVDPDTRIRESFNHIFALCPITSRLIAATYEFFFTSSWTK
jgi:hypothetical protein